MEKERRKMHEWLGKHIEEQGGEKRAQMIVDACEGDPGEGNEPIPLPDELRRELSWMARQYEDDQAAYTLAMRLYDVSCTAKKLLAKYWEGE